MKRLPSMLILAGLLAASTTSMAQEGQAIPEDVRAERISEREWADLLSGKVVLRSETVHDAQGRDSDHIGGYVLANAAWAQAFEILGQHEEETKWYRSCMQGVEVLSRHKEGEVEYAKVRELHKSLWMKMRYTIDYVHDPGKQEIRWLLDKGAKNDMFAEYSGAWRLIALRENRTLIAYHLSGRSSGFVPQFVRNYFTRNQLPEFLNTTKKRVESGGKYE